jgi:HAD superfamily hydrolase (TIGR01484 family)
MKKLLVTDYDNTLYCDEESIKINLNKIDEFRNKGNLFSIASGRSYLNFKDKINTYDLKFDYLILSHGALILDQNMNLIKKYIINEKIIIDIMNFLNNIKKYTFILFNTWSTSKDEKINNISKMTIKFNSIEEAKKIEKILKNKYDDIVTIYQINNKNHYIEIISKEANKSNAIRYIIDKYNISKNNVYTIGNGINDIEMIRDYNGYAMSKSNNKLLTYAIKKYNNVYELIETII